MRHAPPPSRRRGGSLIEILVVIVVFLVGILAVVQIYPVGIGILRTTRNNTVATNLSRAEADRLRSQAGRIADQIAPVSYLVQNGRLTVRIDASRRANELMPSSDPRWTLAPDGTVLDEASQPRGNWARVSGANAFSRVLGEGGRAPAPRFLGNQTGSPYGGLVNLQFAPLFYDRDSSTGIGFPGVVDVYGNVLARRGGDRQNNFPNPTRLDFGQYTVFVVDEEDVNDQDPFGGAVQDQLWLPAAENGGPIRYRVAFNFAITEGNRVNTYDLVFNVVLDPASPPVFAETRPGWRFWVVNLPKLAGQPDDAGDVRFPEANYVDTDFGSVRVNRGYDELRLDATFDANNPYQYKVVSGNLGFLLVNPAAFNTVISKPRGREPMETNVDYTVFDWRIIRDEFRVPRSAPFQQKTILQSLKVAGERGPDVLPYPGIGIELADDLIVEDVDGAPDQYDLMLLDTETGGLILGNFRRVGLSDQGRRDADRLESFTVDKSGGGLSFRDVDGDGSNGLSAYAIFPSVNGVGDWDPNPVLISDIRGRSVRALYQAKGEWSVQVLKAAAQYRVTVVAGASRIQSGECYVGGTNSAGEGELHKLYFPWSDLGRKVIVAEMWYRDLDGNLRSLKDQEFQIRASANNPFGLPFVSLRDKDSRADAFDFSNGYAVRGVRGASLAVRVLWNPETFLLTDDAAQNYRTLERFMRSWRRVETETFLPTGGQN
jgi:type II secretory pathway pseudopilin PulG